MKAETMERIRAQVRARFEARHAARKSATRRGSAAGKNERERIAEGLPTSAVRHPTLEKAPAPAASSRSGRGPKAGGISPRKQAQSKGNGSKPQAAIPGAIISRAVKREGGDKPNGRVALPAASQGLLILDPATIRRSPFNRYYFDANGLTELIEDVTERGVLQPGIVRPVNPPDGRIAWELIAGERRWRAATAAKRDFPAVVRDVTDIEALELQAVENMHREDLNPIDEAHKYEQLRAAYEAEGKNRTQAIEIIHEKTGKAVATIYERLALMKLPSQVIVLIRRGKLPASHAGLLTKLSDPKSALDLAEKILNPRTAGDGEEREEAEGIMSFRGAKRMVDRAVQREKNLAEWQRQAQGFAGKVLTPEESAGIVDGREGSDHWWIKHTAKYVRDDNFCQLPGSNSRQYKQLWKKPPEATLARLPDGRPVVIYAEAAADEAVRAGGKIKKAANGRVSSRSEADRKKDRELKQRRDAFDAAIGGVVNHFETVLLDTAATETEFWRFFARTLVKQWRSEPLQRLRKRRNLPRQTELLPLIASMDHRQLRGFCSEILLYADWPSNWGGKEFGGLIKAACELCEVPLRTSGDEGKPETDDDAES